MQNLSFCLQSVGGLCEPLVQQECFMNTIILAPFPEPCPKSTSPCPSCAEVFVKPVPEETLVAKPLQEPQVSRLSSSSLTARCVAASVKMRDLNEFVGRMPLPPGAGQEVRKAVMEAVESNPDSNMVHQIQMGDPSHGLLYTERLVLKHWKMENGNMGIALAFFTNMQTVWASWNTLESGRHADEVAQWLNALLYRKIREKTQSEPAARLPAKQPVDVKADEF